MGSLAYIALLAAEEEEVVDEPVVIDGDERCGCCCCCSERFLDVRVLPPPELLPLPVPPPRSLDCDLCTILGGLYYRLYSMQAITE